MKYIIAILILTILSGCKTEISDYEKHIIADELRYMRRPDYFDQLKLIVLPEHYSIERKLLLIAHGFDPNVRLCLAEQFSKEIEQNEALKKEVLTYLDSDDPALAWSTAWLCDKCLSDSPDPMPTYKRKDVRSFEDEYQK